MTAPARPLRILEVLEPSGGGSGRHFNDLCGALAQRGHHVEAVYSPLRAEDRFVEELKGAGLAAVHSVNMTRSPGPKDLPALLALNAILARNGPFDIVHGHSSKAGALTRLAPSARKSARIYTPHAFRTMDPTLGAKGRLLFGGIERFLGRHLSDAIIAVSDDERLHALELGLPANRVHTVVNGVNPPPVDQIAAIRKQFRLPPDALVIGFVGRLSQQKAPERLVEAFRRMAAARPEAYLVMIGFGELEDFVAERITESGFQDRIRLDGAIPGPLAIPAFDILAMPSRYEAMSYVMLEAEAAALPMVLSDVGGASTVVDNGQNGLIVPNSDDCTALADALLAATEPTMLARLRAGAEERRHRHSIAAMVNGTLAVYREALERKRK